MILKTDRIQITCTHDTVLRNDFLDKIHPRAEETRLIYLFIFSIDILVSFQSDEYFYKVHTFSNITIFLLRDT